MEFIAINFNKYILPVVAGFASGFTLGWMVGDNDARRHFHKYYPVVIPQAPMHNFYAFANSREDFQRIADILGETDAEVEKLYREKQQSKAGTLH